MKPDTKAPLQRYVVPQPLRSKPLTVTTRFNFWNVSNSRQIQGSLPGATVTDPTTAAKAAGWEDWYETILHNGR